MPQGENRGSTPPSGRGCGPLISLEQGPETSLRAQVFERIRAEGLISRVDLARALAISPASVSTISADLIARGLAMEVDAAKPAQDSNRGRPPVALGVRGAAGAVVGIKLSDEVHTAVLLDFAGNTLATASIRAKAALQGEAQIRSEVALALAEVCRSANRNPKSVLAVGVGLPGVVDPLLGHVLWSPILKGEAQDFAGKLAAALHCPVFIDNDANMVTLAELWFGAGRRLADFAVVTIEHGVGMGLVLNHRLYRGARGMGMEIGHTKVQLDGALCRCGQRGCLEAYVADYALAREALTALAIEPKLRTHDLLERLYEAARDNHPTACMIFQRASRHLALGLSNIVNLFDPSLIILSGERMRSDFLYADEMIAEMARLTLNSARPVPRVEINAWGDMVWAQGAAALALQQAGIRALAA